MGYVLRGILNEYANQGWARDRQFELLEKFMEAYGQGHLDMWDKLKAFLKGQAAQEDAAGPPVISAPLRRFFHAELQRRWGRRDGPPTLRVARVSWGMCSCEVLLVRLGLTSSQAKIVPTIRSQFDSLIERYGWEKELCELVE
jgi:hypothetical protein